jgi:ubiquinone/menaquinone biosynthesis C-methylase UbiE
MISRMAAEGYVCGLDHSDVMLRQAMRRSAAAVHQGRVDLRLGSVDLLPEFAEPFDKAPAVNAIMFSDRTTDRLKALRRVMRPGGRIAIAHQPRGPGATRADTAAKGDAIAAAPTHASFSEVRVHTMKLSPTVVCAIGVKPAMTELKDRLPMPTSIERNTLRHTHEVEQTAVEAL